MTPERGPAAAAAKAKAAPAVSRLAPEVDEGSKKGSSIGQDVHEGDTTLFEPEGGPDRPRRSKSDSGRSLDDSVGDFDTVSPNWEDEGIQHWREGVVVAERFRITGFVGQGGMGKVYLAEDEILRRSTALKRVPQEILFDVDARDDLRQEANRLLDLAHENIVRVHTYYDGPTWPFFAMEYLRGPTLKQLLRDRRRQGGAFSSDEVVRIARQVGEGLRHAHSHNIVHRDLKPANLMIAEPIEGEITDETLVKITDFGISRVVADSTLRQTGKRSGTLPYMSPEQYQGEASTVQSDIYSLSCTLYELITGRPPFHTGDIGYQILHVAPKTFSRGLVPRPVSDTIQRGLSKDPRDRFESIEQFVASLEGAVRVPRRGMTRRLVSVGSKMLGGVALILLLMWASTFFGGGRAGGGAGGDGTPRPAGDGTVVNVDGISSRLREELRTVLQPIYKRPEDVEHLGNPPAISVDLSLRSGPTGIRREVLAGLVFEYRGSSGEYQEAEAAELDGSWSFSLHDLREDDYFLRAYLRRGTAGVGFTNLLDPPLRFRVDLSRPEFEVRVDSEHLVTTSPLSTYDSDVRVSIVPRPNHLGDVERAYYRPIVDGVPKQSISVDFSSWTIPLPEPGEYSFAIYAYDEAENISEPVTLTIRRNTLEVRNVAVSEINGRIAEVEGVLAFDGEGTPELRFFVNDEPADLPGRSGPWSDTGPAEIPGIRPFSVELYLDNSENDIEVRYSWNGGEPRSFSNEARITKVVLPSPTIELDEFPASTNKSEQVISGTIRPYFKGLEIWLEHSGKSQVQLRVEVSGDSARFEQNIQLLGDQRNLFTLVPYYKNSLLSQSSNFEIIHDAQPPECDSVSLLEIGYSEIQVRAHLSEPVRSLRGRVVTARVESSRDFVVLPLEPSREERGP
ncbi:MAG: serine/threonine-protein kinase, partial [Planctomycetota bacterium]